MADHPTPPEYWIEEYYYPDDAISDALEAMEDTGGCLCFKPGVYYLEKPIVIRSSGVWLVGVSTWFYINTQHFTSKQREAGRLVLFEGCAGCGISGIGIRELYLPDAHGLDDPAPVPCVSTGLELRGVTDFCAVALGSMDAIVAIRVLATRSGECRNITLRLGATHYRKCGLHLKTEGGGRIRGVNVYGDLQTSTGTEAQAVLEGDVRNVLFSGTVFQAATKHYVTMDENVRNVVFSNCYFEAQGQATHMVRSAASHVTFVDCVMSAFDGGSDQFALYLEGELLENGEWDPDVPHAGPHYLWNTYCTRIRDPVVDASPGGGNGDVGAYIAYRVGEGWDGSLPQGALVWGMWYGEALYTSLTRHP